jgi:hypothetical protein
MYAEIRTHQSKLARWGSTVPTAVFRVFFTGFVRGVAPICRQTWSSEAEIRPLGCQVDRLSDRPFSGPFEHSSGCDRYARQG